jgi:tetratricopeptide (TPR) repeat protein
MQAEALWAIGDLQRANECFRDFAKANARAVQPRIRWARLFLQTHQYNDAAETFRDALKIFPNDPHAKIGLARVLAERFEDAGPLLEEVLREHDDLVEAHLVSAQLALESGQLEAAQKSLERAGDLATKQKLPPLEIYAMRAALETSRDRDPQPWIKRALDYNPRYGAVYEQLAHFEIMRRRYREATTLLRRSLVGACRAGLESAAPWTDRGSTSATHRCVLRRSVQSDDSQLAASPRSHRSVRHVANTSCGRRRYLCSALAAASQRVVGSRALCD